ncbi:MAG TPA: TlpA disulfide reductase family protein [Balneolales bacterium]|nr:TlpA disulfide reductase family protein [Balneolales bacterium]
MGNFLRKNRKKIIEWSLWIGIPVILYTTGWYTEVIGRMQQVLLYTGIFQAHPVENIASQPLADLNMAMLSMSGRQVNLQQFRGKVLFINFWASWCPPCVAELPTILKLSKEVTNPDVQFILVNLDQDPQKARDFVHRKDITLPVYQPLSRIPSELSSNTIPATFIIDKSGRIALRRKGMAEYDTKSIRNLLNKLASQN